MAGAIKGQFKTKTSYGFQGAIPKDVRAAFGGKQLHKVTFQTTDPIKGEQLVAEAEREFKAKVAEYRLAALNGDRIDPVLIQNLVGYLFFQLWNDQPFEDDFHDLEQKVRSLIFEGWDDKSPMFSFMHTEGAVFDQVVAGIETLFKWANAGVNGQKRVRPGVTLIAAWEIWAKKAKHTQKTKDQYGKDVRDFEKWYEPKHGTPLGRAIQKGHANQYVGYLMSKNVAKATIMRSLSALRLIYKSGQFSVENPFSGVSDRMVIEGDELKPRMFTDDEVLALFDADTDANSHMCIRIAAYTGMRISEICAMKVKHVTQRYGHLALNLKNAGRRKSDAGYRWVPVHTELVAELTAFIRNRDPEDWLIPGEPANKYGDRSGALSKRVNRLIDTHVSEDREIREHCFRHTLISKLAEAGVRKEFRVAIVGHVGAADAHDSYNHGDLFKLLVSEISKVSYRA